MIIKLYDSNKQQLIGVFRNATLVARYLLPGKDAIRSISRVCGGVYRKEKICNSVLNFPVALRVGKEEDLSGNEDYVICGGYPAPTENQMKGFTSTRTTLYKAHVIDKYSLVKAKK